MHPPISLLSHSLLTKKDWSFPDGFDISKECFSGDDGLEREKWDDSHKGDKATEFDILLCHLPKVDKLLTSFLLVRTAPLPFIWAKVLLPESIYLKIALYRNAKMTS